MRFPRSSGILLHPTCLPSPYGIGEFGSEAYAFVDFLREAGQKLWQVLPLNPTGYGDSPFQCFSSIAGNPLLISLEKLRENSVLDTSDFQDQPTFPQGTVEFERLIPWKTGLLQRAAKRFLAAANGQERRDFEEFCSANDDWLSDFALFMACKEENNGVAWNRWPSEIAARSPAAPPAH